MSHTKERNEKNCLNCNSEVAGRFCQTCGQENVEPRESFWHLITHFFNDITHFDGKFFSSLKYLVSKPGFLPMEYIKGRRASYLNPIRMYVFTSALFFLIFYNKFSPNHEPGKGGSLIEFSTEKLDQLQKAGYETAETKEDSIRVDSGIAVLKKLALDHKDSSVTNNNTKIAGVNINYDPIDSKYKTYEDYIKSQDSLPADQRDNWMERQFKRKEIRIANKYGGDSQLFWADIGNKFIHQFPYMLFVSLPLYALFLKLLYVRRKRFYVEHILFLLYLYIFTFLFLLLFFLFTTLKQDMGWTFLKYIQMVMVLGGIYYAYKAMRKFYEQGRVKTLLKFIILNMLALFSLMLIFSLFFGITIFQL